MSKREQHDSIRTNLIMRLYCADCGHQLSLSYPMDYGDKDVELLPKERPIGGFEEEPRLPTGAACRHIPAIHVHPCRHCREQHIGPAKRLADALREFEASQE